MLRINDFQRLPSGKLTCAKQLSKINACGAKIIGRFRSSKRYNTLHTTMHVIYYKLTLCTMIKKFENFQRVILCILIDIRVFFLSEGYLLSTVVVFGTRSRRPLKLKLPQQIQEFKNYAY